MKLSNDPENEPFCNNCGYRLTGLVDSSKCPECGRPIVEVLVRSTPRWGYGRRYASSIVIFGVPLVHMAFGPHGNEPRGHAKGIIAIGDVATGVLAIGGIARGLIAIGGFAAGLISLGGFAAGLLGAMGGFSAGLLACGGGAVGGVVQGGLAIGWIADGGLAVGRYPRGGQLHFIGGGSPNDPRVVQRLTSVEWLIGAPRQPMHLMMWIGVAAAAVALLSALGVAAAYRRQRAPPDPFVR